MVSAFDKRLPRPSRGSVREPLKLLQAFLIHGEILSAIHVDSPQERGDIGELDDHGVGCTSAFIVNEHAAFYRNANDDECDECQQRQDEGEYEDWLDWAAL